MAQQGMGRVLSQQGGPVQQQGMRQNIFQPVGNPQLAQMSRQASQFPHQQLVTAPMGQQMEQTLGIEPTQNRIPDTPSSTGGWTDGQPTSHGTPGQDMGFGQMQILGSSAFTPPPGVPGQQPSQGQLYMQQSNMGTGPFAGLYGVVQNPNRGTGSEPMYPQMISINQEQLLQQYGTQGLIGGMTSVANQQNQVMPRVLSFRQPSQQMDGQLTGQMGQMASPGQLLIHQFPTDIMSRTGSIRTPSFYLLTY